MTEGFVVTIAVVVTNTGLSMLNVTVVVEQDRSPHEIVLAEPAPVKPVDAGSEAELMLRFRAVVEDSLLNSSLLTTHVSTAIFLRAVSIDFLAASPQKTVIVDISVVRASQLVVGGFVLAVAAILIAVIARSRVGWIGLHKK